MDQNKFLNYMKLYYHLNDYLFTFLLKMIKHIILYIILILLIYISSCYIVFDELITEFPLWVLFFYEVMQFNNILIE